MSNPATPVNTVTPRVFIAATHQNDGKTTTALGLFSTLKKRFGRIGFIKPVGQRFEEIEGKQIDEDSLLIGRTYSVDVPIEDMSPIAVEPSFTRRYIDNANPEALIRRIQRSFNRACWEKEFCLIEGTGHAGVGSVFDLSNARVARLLQSKVVIVTTGGIGRPIDEIALNQALFEKEGVEIVGVILNKIIPSKYDYVRDFAKRGLARLGIELIGAIPQETLLANPTLNQICREVRGRFVSKRYEARAKVKKIIVGAMSARNIMDHFQRGTLVITPGDREDVILAALSTTTDKELEDKALAGMILSGDLLPHPTVQELIAESSLPVIATSMDSYRVASSIHSMTIKTLPGDVEKIDRIQALVEQYVDVDRLLEKLGAVPPASNP